MTDLIPTVGRLVHYKLSADDAAQINKRRKDCSEYRKANPELNTGFQVHYGNEAHEGDVFPMLVVRVWDNDLAGVQGQVFLDGNDIFWATSVKRGEGTHEWDWMPFQKDQQARLATEKSA